MYQTSGVRNAYKNNTMIRTFYYNILPMEASVSHSYPSVFLLNKELITILLSLIKSRLNQKLTLELSITTESACNELTVLSCDQYNLSNVVSGSGMPLIVNKSN